MKMKIFALLLGVVVLRVKTADQSEFSISDEQPIENEGGKRRIDTPEVVLQLKYESGELNRIYLTQFRKEKERWSPSVPTRANLCADLCHAGLGGESCGSTCAAMLPVGLQSALHGNSSELAGLGQPRVEVCPTLCQNQLGDPLCNCAALLDFENSTAKVVDWSTVCTAFCADRYVLNGCPACEESTTLSPSSGFISISSFSRVLDTADGWAAWCNVQCHQGQGGAACNCDRSPFA